MLRLILMRHAKSDWNHPEIYDFDRPLNKRGRQSAAALGAWLRTAGHLPDQVLCSSSKRTRETLSRLGFDPQPDTEFAGALYHAEPQAMLEVLMSATGRVVLMIGHNPGICAFARQMVTVPPEHPRFADYPTGATLVCDFDAARWADIRPGQATVVDFVVPRELPG